MLQMKSGIVLCVIVLIAISGCAASPTPTPTSVSTPQVAVQVTVRQLIDGSDKYSEQTIRLTGKIILECPEGCWFFLDDGTGKIYVDLKPAGLTIPQKVGSRIELLGKTKGTGGNLQILGENVRFPDEQ
jgi:uncharacterized protein YdeI (BOF family)